MSAPSSKNQFYFRCSACNKMLHHHTKKNKNGKITEDDLCGECKRIAFEDFLYEKDHLFENNVDYQFD